MPPFSAAQGFGVRGRCALDGVFWCAAILIKFVIIIDQFELIRVELILVTQATELKIELPSNPHRAEYGAGIWAICLALSFIWPLAHAQQSSGTAVPVQTEAAVGQAPAAGNQPSVEVAPNAMTRAVVQRGVLTCAARVEQVTRFLGFGTQAAAHFMPPPAPADQRLFSLQMELPAGANGNSFVDMSFAPQQANGCGATYQAVSFWPLACEAVGRQQFANVGPGQVLQRDVTVFNLGPQTKVFLMSAGPAGCIAIKKEIVL